MWRLCGFPLPNRLARDLEKNRHFDSGIDTMLVQREVPKPMTMNTESLDI